MDRKDPKMRKLEHRLRHESRKRDNWTCQRCGNVVCPHGQACYDWAKFNRGNQAVPMWLKKHKRKLCNGGRDCILRMHHDPPLNKGGTQTLEGVTTLCKECEEKLGPH